MTVYMPVDEQVLVHVNSWTPAFLLRLRLHGNGSQCDRYYPQSDSNSLQ
jgi:hypothetical protein